MASAAWSINSITSPPRSKPTSPVIAIDMRGHGACAWLPTGDYLVEDQVKDWGAFADQLNLRGYHPARQLHRDREM
jgi:pimeloyl-ACP methyl ester carboxylesterase